MHINELHTKVSLKKSPECYVLLPGSSGGLHHPLMKMLYTGLTSRNLSVAMLEYPYQTRNTPPPVNDLSEEITALKTLLKDLETNGYDRFVYIGKSLGGLVATRLMRDDAYRRSCEAIHIMGCVLDRGDEEGIDIQAAKDKIDVIVQGELDDYGDSQAIQRALAENECKARVIGIPDGDHSYRHNGRKDHPTHEREAVDELFAAIGI